MKLPLCKLLKLRKLGVLGIIKTLFLNFKLFPFAKALHFPVFVTAKTELFYLHRGCIEFEGKLFPGKLSFGFQMRETSFNSPNFIRIEGKLILKGDGYHCFASGTTLIIRKNAVLEIGNNFAIMQNSRWLISKRVSIGNDCLFSWNLNMLDTDAHPIYVSNELANFPTPITIGNNVWITSNCSILKGTNIPSGCIIASNSTISKKLQDKNSIYKNNISIRNSISWNRQDI